jgi:ADP-heptose:LPS heptosyltransferase
MNSGLHDAAYILYLNKLTFMAITGKTGHAKNIANFDELISFAITYGTTYNPSNASIKLKALQTLSANANQAIDLVNDSFPVYRTAVKARADAFRPLNKLITRVINSLKASGASRQVEERAKSLERKIQGARATVKTSDETKQAAAAKGKGAKEISSSQMSYVSRLDNFGQLIKLLADISKYAPNEEELKKTSISSLYDSLKAKNTELAAITTLLSKARIARNKLFYTKKTGLVNIAKAVKAYIKSVFGASSPQYKQVSGLAFKAVKV